MVTYKTKKVSKYRGSSNHGGGMRKKRRGAGSRGGRGNAGTGKRAGQKKAGLKNFKLGSIGFRPRREIVITRSINVGDLTVTKLNAWVAEGKATKEGAGFSVDLGGLGYTKLLGAGEVAGKLTIIIPSCSASAEEKIKSKGGQVQVS
jgi:large subunit ribosomal protein L15